MEANWGLGSLGRGDVDPEKSNVYSFVANVTGYVNNDLTINSTSLPLTNLTGNIPGALNTAYWTPVLAPNGTAVGAGGGAVFIGTGTNMSLTSYPVTNLTALGIKNPDQVRLSRRLVSTSARALLTLPRNSRSSPPLRPDLPLLLRAGPLVPPPRRGRAPRASLPPSPPRRWAFSRSLPRSLFKGSGLGREY